MLSTNLETRIVYDLLADDRKAGLFYMAVVGNELGGFDLVYDPMNQDQISAGRLSVRNDRSYFDTWASFPARSVRNGGAPPVARFSLDNFRIEATIENDLNMKAVTRATLKLGQKPAQVIPFSIARKMRITGASIDGRAVEVFDRESEQPALGSPADDRQVLVVPETALDPAKAHEVELHHEGAVIERAGDGVYYVAARGTWYPRIGVDLADYDLVFRYPKNLVLVASGAPVEERTEGNWRITHRKPDSPIRFAGFNLGDFQSVSIEQAGYHIDVYANRSLERALTPRPEEAIPVVPTGRRRRLAAPAEPPDASIGMPQAPDPGARVRELTKSVVDTLEFMTNTLGPAPLAQPCDYSDPGAIRSGISGPDLSFDARLFESRAAACRSAQPAWGDVLFRAPGDP